MLSSHRARQEEHRAPGCVPLPPQGTCPLMKPNTCSAPIPQPSNFPRPSRWWLGALLGGRDVLPSVFLGMLRLVGGLGRGWEQKGTVKEDPRAAGSAQTLPLFPRGCECRC